MELAFIVKGINPKSGEVYRPTNEQWKLQNLKGKLKQSLIGVGNTVIKVKAKKNVLIANKYCSRRGCNTAGN